MGRILTSKELNDFPEGTLLQKFLMEEQKIVQCVVIEKRSACRPSTTVKHVQGILDYIQTNVLKNTTQKKNTNNYLWNRTCSRCRYNVHNVAFLIEIAALYDVCVVTCDTCKNNTYAGNEELCSGAFPSLLAKHVMRDFKND